MDVKPSLTTLPSIKRLLSEAPVREAPQIVKDETIQNIWQDTPYTEQKRLMSLRTLIHPIPLEPSIPDFNNTIAAAGLAMKHNYHMRTQSDVTSKRMSSNKRNKHNALYQSDQHMSQFYHRRSLSEQTFEFVQKQKQHQQQQQIYISSGQSPLTSTSANITTKNIPYFYHEEVEETGSDSTSSSNSSSTSSPIIPSYSDTCKRLPGQLSSKYVCPQCNKRFSRPSSLKTHTYSHTGEKPYVCGFPTCNKKFSVQSNMRRHMKVHPSITHH